MRILLTFKNILATPILACTLFVIALLEVLYRILIKKWLFRIIWHNLASTVTFLLSLANPCSPMRTLLRLTIKGLLTQYFSDDAVYLAVAWVFAEVRAGCWLPGGPFVEAGCAMEALALGALFGILNYVGAQGAEEDGEGIGRGGGEVGITRNKVHMPAHPQPLMLHPTPLRTLPKLLQLLGSLIFLRLCKCLSLGIVSVCSSLTWPLPLAESSASHLRRNGSS